MGMAGALAVAALEIVVVAAAKAKDKAKAGAAATGASAAKAATTTAAPKVAAAAAATTTAAAAATTTAAAATTTAAPEAAAAAGAAVGAASAESAGMMAKILGMYDVFMASPLNVQVAYALLAVLVVVCRAKIVLWLRGIIAFVLWGEKKGMSRVRNANDVVAPKGGEIESKVIIFIRHGESDWNFIFNKSKLLLLPRLVMGALWEALMFPFKNSLFIDSPLSSEGVMDAKKLQRFVAAYEQTPQTSREVNELMKSLRGDAGYHDSVLVTSPLRRAIATGCIGLYPRLQRSDGSEKIIMHTSLQEMSRNVDTMALAGKKQLPEVAVVREALGDGFRARASLDVSEYTGNKKLKRKAVDAMNEFCAWCFQRPEPVIVVAAGHSLWFKNFCKVFLPKASDHPAKTHKVLNCSVMAFNLEKGVMHYDAHQVGYRVVENSITPMYLGFEKLKMQMSYTPKLQLPPKGSSGAKGRAKETNGKNGKHGKEESSFSCCLGK